MSNLLQKASIITTPTAYDTGKILSVKPVQTYGPELVTNGDFSDGTNGWSGQYSATISVVNSQLQVYNNQNGNNRSSQGITTVIGKSYNLKGTITNVDNSNGIQIKISNVFNLDSAYFNSAFNITTNSVKVEHTFIAISTTTYIGTNQNGVIGNTGFLDNVSVKEVLNADFDFTRNSSATRVGSNGFIQDVASNLPRIDYTGGVGSWKFEPQRTNSVSYSEDFSQLSSQSNVTISINQIISPEGSLNASSLIDNSVNGVHRAFSIYGTSIASGQLISHSVFAKAKEHNWFQLSTGGSTNDQWANFDLENGVIGNSSSSANPIIENYGNGWYRCILFATTSANNASLAGLLTLINNLDLTSRSPSYSGSNGGVYVFGLQLEVGSYPTSYIRSNSGSATTRLADVANNAGSSDLISSTEGVLYAEINTFIADGNYRLIGISDGTTSNELVIGYRYDTGKIYYFITVGGIPQSFQISEITSINTFLKVALKYKQNDFAFWVNGVEVLTDTSGITFPSETLNNLNFDRGNGTFPFFGNVKSVAVFKEALTDLELECLVSWMSFSDLGINFGYTVE